MALSLILAASVLLSLLVACRSIVHVLAQHARAEWRLVSASRWLEIAARLGSDRAEGELIDCLLLRGELREAHRLLQRRAKPPGLAGAGGFAVSTDLRRLAVVLSGFDRADEALATLAEARARLPSDEAGANRLSARLDIDEARILYFSKGQLDQAHRLLDRALSTAREIGDLELKAHALRNLGVVLWFRDGNVDPAERYYRPALEMYRAIGHRWGEAVTLSNLALIAREHGEIRTFLHLQDRSLEIKEEIGDALGLAESYTYLASLYRDFGNYRRAFELAESGLAIAQRIGYQLGARILEFRLAEYAYRTGRREEGEQRLEAVAKSTMDPWLSSQRWWRLTEMRLESGRSAAARRSLARALEQARRADADSTEARWWKPLVLARLALVDGQESAAVKALEEARRLAPKRRPLWIERYLLATEIAIAEARSSPRSLELLARLVEVENRELDPRSISPFLGDPMTRSDSREQLMLALLDDRHGSSTTEASRIAHRTLETLRHRTLRNLRITTRGRRGSTSGEPPFPVEAFERSPGSAASSEALHRDYLRWEQWVLASRLDASNVDVVRRHSPRPLEATRAVLPEHTALVEYLVAEDKVGVLVSTRGTSSLLELPVSRTTLEYQVELLRSLLSRTRPEGWRPVASSLGETLIGSLEARGLLGGVHNLYIIPYGVLHRLPFAALLQPDGDRPFVERYSFTQLPAAALLGTNEKQGSRETTAMTFGYGDLATHPLEGAEREALLVAERLTGKAFLGSEASEANLRRWAPRADLLHVAAHGVNVEGWPLLSGLRLAASEEHDGWLTLPEILDLKLQSKLVVLAACRSGQAEGFAAAQGAETDRLALSGAFLYAGARNVLATLLPVQDRATVRLMELFYSELETTEPAAALASAQSTLANNPDVHPGTWASFVLIGRGGESQGQRRKPRADGR